MKRKTTILLMPLILAMAVDPAYAATATKAYVDTQDKTLLANDNKLFANQVLLRDMLNVKDADGNWGTLDTQAQTAIQAINELKALQTDLQTAIEGKQDAGEYLVADDLSELQDAIAELESGKVDPETIAGIQTAIDGLDETYATKTDMTAADQALLDKINAINVPSLEGYVKASDLAKVATTGSYADLDDKPTIPSIEGLVTDEDFQNALATKQSKLTTGSGIKIEETTADDGTVTATISADVNLEDVVGKITDDQGNTITIQQALESKADANTVDTLEGLVGDTSVAEQITDKVGTIADGKTVAEVLDTKADAGALTEYAKSADVADTYATKDSLSGYATTGALADKEDAANKLVAATAEEIEAMSSDEKATKFPTVAVAQTIANAAVTKVNEVAGDLSSLQTQVGTNTADIAEIKAAGYQTLDDVQGEIKTATADLVSENDLGALAYKDTVATADIDSKSVTLDKIAGVVPGENKTMLMSVDAEGNVTWMSVEILK